MRFCCDESQFRYTCKAHGESMGCYYCEFDYTKDCEEQHWVNISLLFRMSAKQIHKSVQYLHWINRYEYLAKMNCKNLMQLMLKKNQNKNFIFNKKRFVEIKIYKFLAPHGSSRRRQVDTLIVLRLLCKCYNSPQNVISITKLFLSIMSDLFHNVCVHLSYPCVTLVYIQGWKISKS